MLPHFEIEHAKDENKKLWKICIDADRTDKIGALKAQNVGVRWICGLLPFRLAKKKEIVSKEK